MHACGRLEAVNLQDLSLSGACAAARLAFDFPEGLELHLERRGGERLEDDEALRSAAAHAETLYVKLSETALRDFERRIDELQHMQIGFLCDQLATLRQEQAEQRQDLGVVRAALEREIGAREAAVEVVRREVVELQATLRKAQKGDEQLEALEVALSAVKQAVRDESLARERVGQESSVMLKELREALDGEGSARKQGEERLRAELEALRRAASLEASDREESARRTERNLETLRSALAQEAEQQVGAAQEAQRHLLDVRQAVASESRDRVAADADLQAAVKELRLSLQGEARERSSEIGRAAARCEEAHGALESERRARQQAVSELTQQLSVAVDSIQEEQALRSSEDVELSQMVETMRRGAEEARRRADESELAVSRLTHDLSKRLDEEARTRDAEVSRLLRKLSEDGEARQEEGGKLGRALASLQQGLEDESERRLRDLREVGQRLDACSAGLKAEQKERQGAVEELTECILRHRSTSREADSEAREFREEVDKDRAARSELEQAVRAALAAEQRERAAMGAELATALKDARAVVERETQARERGDLALSRNVAAAREALEEAVRQQEVLEVKLQQGLARCASLESPDACDGPLRAFAERLRCECQQDIQGDLDAIRDGVAKVVEAVQQERRSRSEGDSKLREDCREAIQKEINARLERDGKLREELEAEARLRQEAVEVIQLAIEECRTGLETHTHELQVDDSPRGASPSERRGTG